MSARPTLWPALVIALSLSCQKAEGGKPEDRSAKPKPVPAASPVPALPPAAKPGEWPPGDETAQDYPVPALPTARVLVGDAFGGSHAVMAEIAATVPARTRGLMWRTKLADTEGMLFIFPVTQRLSFWMRNTLIPLDMIFADETGRIVGVVENAPPQTFDSRGPGEPGKYVLEVPAGWCAKRGVKAGGKLKLDAVSGVVPN